MPYSQQNYAGYEKRAKPAWQLKREQERRDASLKRYSTPISAGYGIGKLPPMVSASVSELPKGHDPISVVREIIGGLTGISPEAETCQKGADHFGLNLNDKNTLRAIHQQAKILKNTAEFEFEDRLSVHHPHPMPYRDALLSVARDWWRAYRQSLEDAENPIRNKTALKTEAFYVAGILRKMMEKKNG